MDNTASTCINQDGVKKIRELSGKIGDNDYRVVDFANLPGIESPQVEQPTTAPKPKTKPGKKKTPKSDECCDVDVNVESLKLVG